MIDDASVNHMPVNTGGTVKDALRRSTGTTLFPHGQRTWRRYQSIALSETDNSSMSGASLSCTLRRCLGSCQTYPQL
jgi:hypothetical protein